MKNNLEHYPRKKNWSKHPKIKMLKLKYGEAGDSKFGTLCDYIADAEWCWLNLSEEYTKVDVADALRFSLEELDQFIEFLFSQCKLIKKNDLGHISTDTAQEALVLVMKEREKAKDRKTKKGHSHEPLKSSPELSSSSPDVPPTETRKESKVKESKGNEIKEKERKVDPPPMIFYVDDEIVLSIKEFLNTNFQILMNDLKFKYGEGFYNECVDDFEKNNIEKFWKDGQDLRSHFTNYIRIRKEKSSAKKEKETVSNVEQRNDENERIKQLNAQKYGE